MIDLKAVRDAAGLSRAELAERMGMSERSGRVTVAQIEKRSDWLVSSVAAFIAAAGGAAELTVKVNGKELKFEL